MIIFVVQSGPSVQLGLVEDNRVCVLAMGAQNTKERTLPAGNHSARTARNRPRPVKDGRQTVSNIFTEHSGMYDLFPNLVLIYLFQSTSLSFVRVIVMAIH